MLACDAIAIILLHGEYGWRGWVFTALWCFFLLKLFNHLAARATKYTPGKRRDRKGRSRVR